VWGEADEERAAIVEYEGNIPRDGLRALPGSIPIIRPAMCTASTGSPSWCPRACARTREAGNPRVTKLAAAHLVGLIEPEDIANMAVFLASEESRAGDVWVVGSRRARG
jgi:hypothetical protein